MLGATPPQSTDWGFISVIVAGIGIVVGALIGLRQIQLAEQPGKKRAKSKPAEIAVPSNDLIQLRLSQPKPSKPPKIVSGREQELEFLRCFLAGPLDKIRGLAWLIGQRGVGKTTIMRQIEWELSEKTPRSYVLYGHCEKGKEQDPLFSLRTALVDFFQAADRAEEQGKLREMAPRVYALLPGISDEPEDDAQTRVRAPLMVAISPIPELTAFFTWLSARASVVLMIEDAHWIDQETEIFLSHLFSRKPPSNICAIISVRAEELLQNKPLSDLYHDLQLTGHHTELLLKPLDKDGVRDMLREALGDRVIAAQVAPTLAEATGGIPLVVDNAIPELKKRGFIVKVGNDWKLVGDDGQIRAALRQGLEMLVESSLRELDGTDKLLLEIGSIEGVEFDSCVLARVIGMNTIECESRLSDLSMRHHFITLVAEDRNHASDPYLRFRFDHSFYSDILRKQLTPSQRKDLSCKAAEAIQVEFPQRTKQTPLELAELYRIAGDRVKERLYLVRGTLQQLSLGAFGSAISSARKAESLYVDAVDAADLNDYRDVLVALGVSLTALNGYANEEAHRAYQNAITIGIETKLPPHFPTLYGIWMYKLVSGVMTDADVDAKQMLQTALSEERFAVDRPQAYWAMGVTQYFIGNVVEAKRHFEAGIQLYEESRHAYYATSYVLDPGVANRYLLARALWFLGYPDQASRMVEESLALAKRLDHTESLAFAIVSAAIVHSVRGEPAKVKRLAEELFRISENDEHRQHWPWAKILHGWAIGAEGDAIQGLTELRQGLDRYEQMGAKLALSGFYAMEAHLCYRAGRLDEEAKVIRKAQEHINITGQRYYHPEFLRLEARNRGLRGLTDRNQLVLQLQAAREAALEIKSRSGELRIVSDLAEAFDQDGRPREALQLLEGFLRDFAEGADTTDVRRAAELLDRLQTKSLATP